jgi:hypothetical protein
MLPAHQLQGELAISVPRYRQPRATITAGKGYSLIISFAHLHSIQMHIQMFCMQVLFAASQALFRMQEKLCRMAEAQKNEKSWSLPFHPSRSLIFTCRTRRKFQLHCDRLEACSGLRHGTRCAACLCNACSLPLMPLPAAHAADSWPSQQPQQWAAAGRRPGKRRIPPQMLTRRIAASLRLERTLKPGRGLNAATLHCESGAAPLPCDAGACCDATVVQVEKQPLHVLARSGC